MMTAATFRGYEPHTIPTADLKVGMVINFPGVGALCDIMSIRREGDETVLTTTYEKFGRLRRSSVRRKTAGHSTIQVRQDPGRCADCGDPLAWVGKPGSDCIHAWSGRLGMPDHPYDHDAKAPVR